MGRGAGLTLYRQLQRQLVQQVRGFLRAQYDLDLPNIVVEEPPKVEMGEYALPLAFELARKLRKPPRKIAEEIVSAIGPIAGFEKLEVAGAGYINARLKRAEAAADLVRGVEAKLAAAEREQLARRFGPRMATPATRRRSTSKCSW